MNTSRLFLYVTAGLFLGLASCTKNAPVQKGDASDPASRIAQVTNDAAGGRMKITIGSKTFKATLEDNSTVAKLKTLLPLTLNMTELNGNEKYYHLSTRLPTDAISPGTIQNGDLMLYGNNSLVPFLQDIRDDLQLHTAWADRRSLGPRRCGR